MLRGVSSCKLQPVLQLLTGHERLSASAGLLDRIYPKLAKTTNTLSRSALP